MSAEEKRELDAWIAEHVMGHRRRNRNGRDEMEFPLDDGTTKWIGPSLWPNYTTNDADAMAVLKVCAKKRTAHWDKYCPDVTLSISSPRPEWDNKWIIMSDAEGTITAEADTLPEAICLFSKKLHGG